MKNRVWNDSWKRSCSSSWLINSFFHFLQFSFTTNWHTMITLTLSKCSTFLISESIYHSADINSFDSLLVLWKLLRIFLKPLLFMEEDPEVFETVRKFSVRFLEKLKPSVTYSNYVTMWGVLYWALLSCQLTAPSKRALKRNSAILLKTTTSSSIIYSVQKWTIWR